MATRQSSESAELKQLRKRVAELEEKVRASEEMRERNAYSLLQISPTENRTADDEKPLDDKMLLGSLLYHLDDGVIVVDPEGEMILFNEGKNYT